MVQKKVFEMDGKFYRKMTAAEVKNLDIEMDWFPYKGQRVLVTPVESA